MLGLLHRPTPALPDDLSSAAPSGGLEQLSFLIGGTWVTQSGSTTCEESCAWGPERLFIQTRVVKKQNGKVTATCVGLFLWNPVESALVSTSLAASSLYWLTQVPAEETGSWAFAGPAPSQPGATLHVAMTRTGPDQIQIVQTEVAHGKVSVSPPVIYNRLRGSQTAAG